MVDLRGRVKADAETALHEGGDRLLERGDAVVCVAAVFELVGLAPEHLADERVGHVVVLADAEVEQRALGMSSESGALGPLDLLEFVDLVTLAIVDAADALGEQ